MTEGSSHSPGPWTAVENAAWTPWPEAIEIKSGEHSVAWLTANASQRERDRADARVIAAALDMLAALSAASGYLLNAKIDLETGRLKRTAIRTIEGGLKIVTEAIVKATAPR